MSSILPIRKRDRLRSLFNKHTGSSSHSNGNQMFPQSGAASISQPTKLPVLAQAQPIDPSRDFLKDTLEALTTDERSIIEQYVVTDIYGTINAAYDAAKDHKAECERKRWPGSARAEKVVLWLDKLKSIGDVAAGLDPVHAGLPWAAVKMLLGVVVADSKRMAALIGGLDLVLWTANQLRAYFAYYQRLPPDPESESFRKRLLDLYIHNLRFLAKAIQTYSKDAFTRRWDAFWSEEDLTKFGDCIGSLVIQADIAANTCERKLQAGRWKDELDARLNEINRIKNIEDSLSALHMKIDLSKLVLAREATYNSVVEEKLGVCLDETRTDLLQRVMAWAEAPDGKQLFWLFGKAGTGKSTISRTVAQIFDDRKRLGASFFFKRDYNGRSDASRFFSTIVAQLADRVPPMRKEIAEALEEDSFLPEKGIRLQFQKLFDDPLKAITTTNLPTDRLIIVIDALDECDSTDAETLLDLFAGLKHSVALRLRVFITCRPETTMEVKFRQISDTSKEYINLDQVQLLTIRDDLHRYLEHRISKIKRDWKARRPRETFPDDWPTKSELERIVDMSIPLFIFAATVCGFLSERDPRVQLQKVLENQRLVSSKQGRGEQTHLQLIYSRVLEQASAHATTRYDSVEIARFRELVCSLALLREPLSVSALAQLLDLENSDVQDVLDDLSSVLDNQGDPHEPVQFLHLSFREFLIEQMNDEESILGMNVEKANSLLWHKCLNLLNRPGVMHYDLFDLGRPMIKQDWRADNDLATRLPPEVAYACASWVGHLESSKDDILDEGKVHKFLHKHSLHWAEATYVLPLFSVTAQLHRIRIIAERCGSDELTAFLGDLDMLFRLPNAGFISWPLHVYQLAAVLATKSNRLQSICDHNATQIWAPIAVKSTQHNADKNRPQNDDAAVYSVKFSPDGSMVALATWDGTILLSETKNGTTIKTLEASNGNCKWCPPAIFSPGGQVIAATYGNAEVWLWDVQTGEVNHKLKDHFISVEHVLFSDDGQLLVSTDTQKTIRTWNVQTGAKVAENSLSCRGTIESMALSPDGQLVAFGLRFREEDIVILRNMSPWKEIRTLTGFVGMVNELAFSSTGQLLATWTGHTDTLRLWDLRTFEMTAQIDDVPPAERLSFSADGRYLYRGNTIFTVGSDGKIRHTEREKTRLGIERGWACYGGEELLCLNPIVKSYKKGAVRDRTLVYEIESGEVAFLRLVDA